LTKICKRLQTILDPPSCDPEFINKVDTAGIAKSELCFPLILIEILSNSLLLVMPNNEGVLLTASTQAYSNIPFPS
jgi:hypothetical protein